MLSGGVEQLVRPELLDLKAYRRPILRFLTASKFLSLISQRAVWFSRLGALEDQYEGHMPFLTKQRIQSEAQKWIETFPRPEHRRQLRESADRNERDGRQMLAVNCWFGGERESAQMWQTYVGSTDGVAIESSCERLVESLPHREYAGIGLVRYVDFEVEDMGRYLGSQAIERAFLKRLEFSGERELRVATMNWIAPGCLNPDGTLPTRQQLAGQDVFDPNRHGFFIQANVERMVRSVRLAPGASSHFEKAIQDAITGSGLGFTLERSSLE